MCVYVPDNRGEEHAGTTLLCPDRQQDYHSRGYHSFIFKTHTDEHVHTRSLDGNNGNTHIFDQVEVAFRVISPFSFFIYLNPEPDLT